MRTLTVRIPDTDHAVLAQIAQKTGKPMVAILAEAIRELQHRYLLRETNEAYARLKEDPKVWREETAERALWDNTLADGME